MRSGRSAVVVFLASLAAGCGAAGGGGGGTTTVTITSASCSQSSSAPTYALGKVLAKGTVGGSAGTRFQFAIANGGETGVDVTCGGWTLDQTAGANNISCTNASGPATVTWTVTQDVSWCLSGCDPSTASNNVDSKVKHTYADVYDPSNNKTEVTKDVTCP